MNLNKINFKLIKLIKNYKFILNNLIKPINHFFLNPLDREQIIFNQNKINLKLIYIIFSKQTTFYNLKLKKKARLKRKILRKITKIKYLEN